MTGAAQRGGIQDLIQRTSVLDIVGDMIRVRANEAALGDLAEVENVDGAISTARVVGLDHDVVSLQVFAGGKGLSTRAKVRFLGHPLQVTYSDNILGEPQELLMKQELIGTVSPALRVRAHTP
jgi:V/A-type H+-transporting ATPase subunit B